MADDENSSDNFPGLNKRHGFFRAIERNQRDRDLYHQRRTEEHRNDTKKKRHSDKKYPEKAIYRPPHLRDRGQTTTGSSQHNPPPPSGVYKLEIEVAPKTWHKQVVDKVGTSEETASNIKKRYGLNEIQRDAIQNMIEEFEMSLKL